MVSTFRFQMQSMIPNAIIVAAERDRHPQGHEVQPHRHGPAGKKSQSDQEGAATRPEPLDLLSPHIHRCRPANARCSQGRALPRHPPPVSPYFVREPFAECFFSDVKPANMCIGRDHTKDESGKIFLIDYNMARRFKREDGSLITERPEASFRGTYRYASLRTHDRKDQVRYENLWDCSCLRIVFSVSQG